MLTRGSHETQPGAVVTDSRCGADKTGTMSASNDLIQDGIYFDIRLDVGTVARPALFLDRDGVVVELVDYLHRPEDVRLIAGSGEVIATFNRAGVPVVLVSNQSGIGRGMFDWAAFMATQAEVDRQLAERGATLDAVAACPFHAEALPPYRHADHPFRKPNPGMVHGLVSRMGLDVARSWLVGDHLCDVELADRAGLAGVVHVATGHGSRYRPDVARRVEGGQTVLMFDTFADAAAPLLESLLGASKP